jgi:Raf kinase inhibitor-like YbhB/YbcL family protein
MTMTLSSTAFADDGVIPRRHTCDAEGLSPPLSISGAPSGTQEFALLAEDPDAPGGTFVHWVAWGIDASTGTVPEAVSPPGTGRNGFGRPGYGGPCPPPGPAHRYVFTAFAVSQAVDLRPGASADDLRRAIRGSVLAESSLTGRYSRS